MIEFIALIELQTAKVDEDSMCVFAEMLAHRLSLYPSELNRKMRQCVFRRIPTRPKRMHVCIAELWPTTMNKIERIK